LPGNADPVVEPARHEAPARAVPKLLEVRNLRAGHGRTPLITDVSLELGAGETLALLGEEGVGKTLLMSTIAGLMRVSGGTIHLDGVAITGLDSARVCNLGVAMVPAGRQVFPALSVADNLKAGATIARARARAPELFERVYALFPKLAARRGQIAGTLSGGEQQLLAIGRCLMSAPRLVMLDEPTQGLAEPTRDEVYAVLAALRADGLAILLTESDEALALAFADRACVLADGRVRAVA